jgi:methylated-DNA-protein-cysteine methyltransferase-like protein
MPRSAAYARIKRDVYAIARAVPRGRVTSYRALGDFLDVVPRQVAYLLALTGDEDRELVPWHRVVGDDGALGRPKRDFHGRTQAELLAAEGVAVERGVVTELAQRWWQPTTKATGVVPVRRDSAPA